MKRLMIIMAVAGATAVSSYGQNLLERLQKKGYFTDLEVGVTLGTTGLGFDVSTPITEWTRLHIGGTFMPKANYNARFSAEMGEGLSEELQDSRFDKMSRVMQSFMGITPTKYVDMEATLHMNHFKLLVDVFPFKNNRNWYVTAGVYIGNGDLATLRNSPESMNNLIAMNAYNKMYRNALAGKSIISYTDPEGSSYEIESGDLQDAFRTWGRMVDENGNEKYEVNHSKNNDKRHPVECDVINYYHTEHGMTVRVGQYAHDIIADQDIYWDNDEKLDNPYYRDNGDGTSTLIEYRHRKGEIRYRKGDVMHKAEEDFRMLPNQKNMIESKVHVNKVKPYIGVGYTRALDKKGRFHFAANAGILFWGGKPSMDFETTLGQDAEGNPVYGTIDMIRDLKNIDGKPGTYVKTVKTFTIWPEISVRFSQRF